MATTVSRGWSRGVGGRGFRRQRQELRQAETEKNRKAKRQKRETEAGVDTGGD